MDTTAGEGLRRRRGGGREGHARNAAPQQRPWAQPRMRYRPTEVVSADELESIHLGSLRVLSEIGMDFLDADAREVLRAAGAHVEPGTQRVRFDPAMVTELIRTAPSTFTLHARNPAHDIASGGDWIAFGTVGSPPNVADLDRGRRIGNRADYQNLLRLGQIAQRRSTSWRATRSSRSTSTTASATSTRSYDALTLMDKPIHAYSLGRQRNLDALEMVRIARGRGRRDARPRAVDLHGRQLELAAAARHADAPGDHGVRGPQPGRVHHAVHARRGDGAGDPRRRARRAERRGAGRDGPDPGRPTRARRSSTAASPRTSTCSRARPPSGRRSTCGPR